MFINQVTSKYSIQSNAFSKSTKDWIETYIDFETYYESDPVSPSPQIVKEIEPYKLKKKTILYRGFTATNNPLGELRNSELLSDLGLEQFPKVGDSFQLTDNHLSSWTKSLEVGKNFGQSILVSYSASPDESLLDFTELSSPITTEEEVLLKPGKYLVKVLFVDNSSTV